MFSKISPVIHFLASGLIVSANVAPITVPLRARAIGPAKGGLTSYTDFTELQWYGEIKVGTPAQTFKVIFDTGSNMTYLPGPSCGAPCTSKPAFDGTKSSTFKDLATVVPTRLTRGRGTKPIAGTCQKLTLSLVQDNITVFGLSAGSTQFYTVLNRTNPDVGGAPWDGILGLPNKRAGVFQNLVNAGLPALFSLYFEPPSVGKGADEIMLGGINNNLYKNSLTYFPLADPNSDKWQLFSPGLFVNATTDSVMRTHRNWTIDSGTSNLVVPKDLAKAMYAQISPDIRPIGLLGAYGIECNKIASMIDALESSIEISFVAADGVIRFIEVPTEELNRGPFDPSDNSASALCRTVIEANDDFLIVGTSMLKHWYSVWDQANGRMGFARTETIDV